VSRSSARNRFAFAAGSTITNPSGVGVTSNDFAVTSSERGSRSALEFPALKTFAVIMLLRCIYETLRSSRDLLLRGSSFAAHAICMDALKDLSVPDKAAVDLSRHAGWR